MANIHCPACGHEILNFEDVIAAEATEFRSLQQNLLYDLVVKEEKALQNLDIANDYRLCKALAACYELHDYLANAIAADSREDC